MSEVFADSPNAIETTTSTFITTKATDLESQGITKVDETVYDPDEEPEVEIPQSVDDEPKKSMPATASSTEKKGTAAPSSSFFHYTNILTLVITISMFVALIYGILDVAGAFDKNDDNRSQQQDDLAEENVILDVCSLDSNNEFDIRGDGSLLLRQFINTGDDTVTVQLEYNDIGWVAMAFSESTSMIPNTAIIALPDDNKVQKYSLASKSLSGVVPLESSQQTLTDATVTQEDGRTIMTFTKKLVESDEVAVVEGTNKFNWAFGSSNTLAFHAKRGSATLKFDLCLESNSNNDENNSNPTPPVAAPVTIPTAAPITAAPVTLPTTAPIVAPTFYAAPIPAPVGFGY